MTVAPQKLHLAPGQHVAHEGRRHHQQEDHHAQHPQQLARRLVGAVVEAAEDVDVDHDEEHRGAVGVGVAQQPAVVHVAHDVLDAVEGHAGMRRVVHRQHDAGDDLQHQDDHGERAEVPEVVEVPGRRKRPELLLHQVKIGSRRSIQRRPGWRRRSCAVRCRSLRCSSADPDLGVGGEGVVGHREVLRRRTLADAAGGVVVRAVAGAEPAAVVARGSLGFWPSGTQPRWVQMPTTTSHSGLLDPRLVGLRVPQLGERDRAGLLDLLGACGGGRRPACRAT